jgi:hypothetical protein
MFSTIVVGSLLSDLINLYVNDYMAEKVIAQLIESTIWVHKIDVGKRGIVTEADYCVFKLLQMHKLDAHLLERLINRFAELDEKGGDLTGGLEIGYEVPSKEQVQEMMAMTQGTGMTLQEAWKNHKTGQYTLITPPPTHEAVIIRELREGSASVIQVSLLIAGSSMFFRRVRFLKVYCDSCFVGGSSEASSWCCKSISSKWPLRRRSKRGSHWREL